MPFFVFALLGATIVAGIGSAWETLHDPEKGWRGASVRGLAYAVALSLLVALALYLRGWVVPAHHAMYVDEPWYAEAACHLARQGRLEVCTQGWEGPICEAYGKGPGWPVLLAPWMALFGCDSILAIRVGCGLGVAAVVLLASLARRLAGSRLAGLSAAALLAMHPVHVAWSATAETNVPQATVWLLGMYGLLRFLADSSSWSGVLAVSAWGLATTMRPESLLPALVAAAYVTGTATTTRQSRVGFGLGVVATASALTALPLWEMNQEVSRGFFLSPAAGVRNLEAIAAAPHAHVHAWVVALAVVALCVATPRNQRRFVTVLALVSLAASFVPLAYERFHERMLLPVHVGALALVPMLAGAGTVHRLSRRWLGRALALLVASLLVGGAALSWSRDWRELATPPESQILETRMVRRLAHAELPAASLIVASEPAVVGAAGLVAAMPLARALAQPEDLRQRLRSGTAVYFLCDMYCEAGFQGGAGEAACDALLGGFALVETIVESYNDRNYILYRLREGEDGEGVRRCPRR